VIQYISMNHGDIAKNIKQIYANAAQQIRNIHKKRLNILREILEQRAREKAQKKAENTYKFSDKEIKARAQKIMSTYSQGMDNISHLRHEGLKIIDKAEREESAKKAARIRQSIFLNL